MSNYYLVPTSMRRTDDSNNKKNVNVIIRLPQQPIPCTHNVIQEQVNCKRPFKDSLIILFLNNNATLLFLVDFVFFPYNSIGKDKNNL